jgi:hypothetical protein
MTRAFPVAWKPRDLALTHDQLEADIVKYLQLRGWYVERTHGPHNHPVHKGILDLRADKAGWRSMAIEVKVGRDKMSAEQLKVAEELRAAGIIVFEARSVQDVAEQIEKAGRNHESK